MTHNSPSSFFIHIPTGSTMEKLQYPAWLDAKNLATCLISLIMLISLICINFLDHNPMTSSSSNLDFFITVKTTRKFHDLRLPDILQTWFKLAPKNIFFVTDARDDRLAGKTGGQVIVTQCPPTHNRRALCCKMAAELDAYLKSDKSWFCHFDDDNYVNIRKLEEILQKFDPKRDFYLGKTSTNRPIDLLYRENGITKKISFRFATGGAGFCLSRSLALRMAPLVSDGKFMQIGEKIRLPDDVTLGFIIEHLLKRRLIVLENFHSHLESMKSIPVEKLSDQISLSAGTYSKTKKNVLNLDNRFHPLPDDRRFKSLHCLLYPEYCKV